MLLFFFKKGPKLGCPISEVRDHPVSQHHEVEIQFHTRYRNVLLRESRVWYFQSFHFIKYSRIINRPLRRTIMGIHPSIHQISTVQPTPERQEFEPRVATMGREVLFHPASSRKTIAMFSFPFCHYHPVLHSKPGEPLPHISPYHPFPTLPHISPPLTPKPPPYIILRNGSILNSLLRLCASIISLALTLSLSSSSLLVFSRNSS